MPVSELERTPWVRQENDQRKGRKGRKPPATIRRVRFVNDFNHVDGRCGSRFAPLGAAETGGNSLQNTLIWKLSAVLLSQPRGARPAVIGKTLAETAETGWRNSAAPARPT
jgi:hypothetical protein